MKARIIKPQCGIGAASLAALRLSTRGYLFIRFALVDLAAAERRLPAAFDVKVEEICVRQEGTTLKGTCQGFHKIKLFLSQWSSESDWEVALDDL